MLLVCKVLYHRKIPILNAENMNNLSTPKPPSPFSCFTKWQVAFLAFAICYAVVLLLSLTHLPMEWDEVVHLNGGLYLQNGLYTSFLNNNAFYPPLFDGFTAISFSVFGASLLSARLVTVLFSVLSLLVIFELAKSMYGEKTALLSAVLLGLMPGFFWLSRMALLESMLLFFVSLALLIFYRWLQNKHDIYLVLSGLALGLGFLTKYQAIVAGAIMIVSIVFLMRGQLKRTFTRFTFLVAAGVAVVVPWVIVAYQVYSSKIFSQWLYALSVGNPEKAVYSDRYPLPIFYFIEVAWPFNTFHPISIFVYALALGGLGLLVWRHSKNDQFTLIWFIAIYIFFTLITNKEWRYVLLLFPALSISTAGLLALFYGKIGNAIKRQTVASKRRNLKVAAGVLVGLTAFAMVYSVYDAYSVVSYYDIQIPLEPATLYALNHMENNQTIMVMCPFNFFSQDMIKFYLAKNGNDQIRVLQYPELPVDTYTLNFNITQLISQCKENNVIFLFTYEYGGTALYYNTTLNLQQLYEQIYSSGNFSEISSEATFGTNPRRILLLTFLG